MLLFLFPAAIPADALVFPADGEEVIPLLGAGGEMVSATGFVGVMQAVLRHFVFGAGVEGDALVVPAFGHQSSLFRFVHGVKMLAGDRIIKSVDRLSRRF